MPSYTKEKCMRLPHIWLWLGGIIAGVALALPLGVSP